VKIKYVFQAGDFYPVFIFFSNYPRYVADNYKKFLENLIRNKYGFNGVPMTLSFKEK
jgi:GTP-binding protein